MLPYVFWIFIGYIIAFVLTKVNIVNWFAQPNLYNIAYSLIFKPSSSIMAPGWFAVMIFEVTVIYIVLLKLTPRNKVSDYMILFVVMAWGFFSLWLCKYQYKAEVFWIVFYRTGFYFQFYHIGYMFRQYWEKTFSKWNKGLICLICIGINAIIICLARNKMLFILTSDMVSFKSWYLPIVTSVTGILFWYEVMSFLSMKIGKSKFIEFLSRNTFTIMMVHFPLVKIPYFYVKYVVGKDIGLYNDFNMLAFDRTALYIYDNYEINLVGFITGFVGSILIAWLMEQATRKLKARFSIKKDV